MQASGTIADVTATHEERALGRLGSSVEQERINTRLEEERTAAAINSLDSMQQLRQILASQRTMFAARGQSATAGTAFDIQQASVSEFESDERTRRMNLLMKESTLRSAGASSSLSTLSSETKLGKSLSQRAFDKVDFSELSKQFEKLTSKEKGK